MLCYFSPNIYPELEIEDITGVQVGTEYLLPVCPIGMFLDSDNKEKDSHSINLISFPSEAFFGRLLQKECLSKLPNTRFELVYETALTEGVKAMVMQGAGMAWLPARMVQKEIDQGDINVIKDFPTIEMKIMLYRKSSSCKEETMDFWQHINPE